MKEPKPKKTKYKTTLHLGLIPEHDIFHQLERYEPLADYLSKKIQANINLVILTRYGNIVDNFVSGGLDAAFFGSFTYTLAHSKLGVEVIARPENNLGISEYYGIIFVRKVSGIRSIKDMKGKILACVDKATTAGYLFPMAYFKKNGIADYKRFFKETYFTGTHEDAIYDVLDGKAHIGSAKNTVFLRAADLDPRINNELDIIAESSKVPENGLAVRKDLDESLKKKLKEALLNMDKESDGIKVLNDFGVKRFIETSDIDYVNVYKLLNHIGIKLSTYEYMNE
ncbi:MAG: phosphate/phosphite/phosphonate ABC transporter substrate-binding protein [Desulfobacterales bacterium]|nr:phosphate/phosphite/phosphonate ABC transporter substrate-binding protein [Desulfobacterales bacterium]